MDLLCSQHHEYIYLVPKIESCKIKGTNQLTNIHQIIFKEPTYLIEQPRESLYEYNEPQTDEYRCPIYKMQNTNSNTMILKVLAGVASFFIEMQSEEVHFDFTTQSKKEDILCKLIFSTNINGNLDQSFRNLIKKGRRPALYYINLFQSFLVYFMFRATRKESKPCSPKCRLKKKVEYFLKFDYDIIHEAVCGNEMGRLLKSLSSEY